MALPGLGIHLTLTAGPDFTQDTYTALVAGTLGNVGTDGDELDVSTQALAALMAAYEAEVQDGLAAEDVPAFDGAPFDTAIDDAMLATLAVADAEEIAINGGLQFLFDAVGAWGALNGIIDLINTAISSVLDIINGILSLQASRLITDAATISGLIYENTLITNENVLLQEEVDFLLQQCGDACSGTGPLG